MAKDRATEALPKWWDLVRASGLQGFEVFLTALANWREEIRHSFLQRQSRGFGDGLNHKLKVLKRRCYGLDSVKPLFQHLWVDLKGYGVFGMG